MNTGLWLLPSRGRVFDKLPRFLAAAIATGISTPGAVLVDDEDYARNADAYDALILPKDWTVHCVRGGSLGAATRQGFADLCVDAQWVGFLADDLVPETLGWDRHVIDQLNGHNFVSTNDGLHAPQKASGAIAFSAEFVEAMGGIFPGNLSHMYVDDAWERLGRAAPCWTVLMNVMVRHVHVSVTGQKDATTDHTNTFWDLDERRYVDWCESEFLPTVERILALMGDHGVPLVKADLSGVKILISCPSGDGTFGRLFVRSLMNTEKALTQLGAEARFMDFSFCSDIALARNKMFGIFLRSANTHMLSVDSDMGWDPGAVVRLLMAKKDFCAAAGPRKVFPASYAVNVSDDFGNAMPIHQDPASGLLEVTHVGGAFVLVTKSWAERMSQHYADLKFKHADARTEYGIFNPMIIGGQYRGEDFAVCQRWRDMGGKVYVDPDIDLSHTGAFTWSGTWADNLREKMAREGAA